MKKNYTGIERRRGQSLLAKSLRYIILIPFIISGSSLFSQDYFPENGILYSNESLPRIDITISQASMDSILKPGNERNDIEYMATFTFSQGSYSTTIDSVGFRLRGNTSRYSAKKSFKVSLNTFIPGQKFDGVEKINLNGEHNDPTIARSRLSWYLFREGGVPASRANHVTLYINGEYKGLYINVEHIDEEFVDLRYGNNDGNLYKCLYPADLAYLGSSPELYKAGSEERRTYDLKINKDRDDYSDLAHFIDILNNTSTSYYPVELNKVFNVNLYLKYMAFEVLFGHWDAYSYNKNNYYLYHNEGTDKFEFIPYDLDNTFGISWFEENWTHRDIYHWSNENEARPLMQRILQNQVYKDRYSFYMNRFISDLFNNDVVDPILDSVLEQIKDAAAPDIYRTLDYGYSYNDFINSYTSATGAHVRTGITEFVGLRSASALQQLVVNPVDPIISLLYANKPDLFKKAKVQFMVEDDGIIEEVNAYFSSGGDFTPVTLTYLGENIYAAEHPGLSIPGTLYYYFEARDDAGNVSRDPLEGNYIMNFTTTGTDPVISPDTWKIQVYPNPASDYIAFEFPAYGEYAYTITDLSGRSVQEGILEGYNARIGLDPELVNGFYLLSLEARDRNGFAEKLSGSFVIYRR